MIMVSGRSSSSEESSCSLPGVVNGGGVSSGGGGATLLLGQLTNNGGGGESDLLTSSTIPPPPPPPELVPTNLPAEEEEEEEMSNNNNILVTLQEKRVISEFCHLLEKSKQLFNQLRDLPPHFSTLGSACNPHHHRPNNGITTTTTSISHHHHHHHQGGSPISCQQAYFSRAFDIYTRLWKFQQIHRQLLDKKYGLKRWQIGDIASKIGQLYYHYYLRTSELGYLQEAFSFYGAIRARGYYSHHHHHNNRRGDEVSGGGGSRSSEISPQSSSSSSSSAALLIVKKLRYYARFIVVALLLRKNNVKDLLRELSVQVENYVATVEDEPEEQLEWNLVLGELRSFIEADSPVVVYDNSTTDKLLDPSYLDQVVILTHRLPHRGDVRPHPTTKNTPPALEELLKEPKYKLNEVVIVGNKQDQIKFSELTVDMFRMAQTLERSPSSLFDDTTTTTTTTRTNYLPLSLGGGGGGGPPAVGDPAGGGDCNKNPHKYLLYRAPIEQILVTVNAAWSDLAWNGVLLLYLSGDPCYSSCATTTTTTTTNSSSSSSSGGIATPHGTKGLKHKVNSDGGGGGGEGERMEINCLYPSDLVPLTRKPFVLIVDSDNSHSFLELSRLNKFNQQPLLILTSPQKSIIINGGGSGGGGGGGGGSILTLFLHCPLAGLCSLSGIKSLSLTTWNQLEHILNIFFKETLHKIKQEDSSWGEVYLKFIPSSSAVGVVGAEAVGAAAEEEDDFLQTLILRFLFCQVVFEMHKDFKQNAQLRPKSYPDLSLLLMLSKKEEEEEEISRFEQLVYEMTDLIQSKHLFNQLAFSWNGLKRRSLVRQEEEEEAQTIFELDLATVVGPLLAIMSAALERNITAIDQHYRQLPPYLKNQVTDFISIFIELLRNPQL